MFKASAFVALLSLAASVRAAQPAWAQCGGTNWTGDKTCVSGTTCTVINDFYWQCIPGGTGGPTTTGGGTSPSTTTNTGPAPSADPNNPFVGYTAYLSPYYAAEVEKAAANYTDATLKAKALKVKSIPTFIWFDVIAKVPDLGTYLADALSLQKSSGKKYAVQIVVYDLPDRDCAAAASNGEFSIANDGLNKYKGYIDGLVAQIKKYPDVRVIAVIEPDSLANLVTNLNVAKCAGAQTAYKSGVTYALQQLASVGVYMYMDAGHAGWLGWPANLDPAAKLFADMYKAAGSSKFIRGLATNVANYNALQASSPGQETQGNPNYDEIHYINGLAPAVRNQGFPAQFIVDQGRSGQQNIRTVWGDWCNVKGAGFGIRPTTSTPSSYIDAIVWVKPGGECDGTSDTSAQRYDSHCGLDSAMKPAPEAGSWFDAYFQVLVTKANPAL